MRLSMFNVLYLIVYCWIYLHSRNYDLNPSVNFFSQKCVPVNFFLEILPPAPLKTFPTPSLNGFFLNGFLYYQN